MPRGPRKVYGGALLNVISRGNNKRIIFRKDADYTSFKKLLHKYANEHRLTIYHYCLMRNHVHLIVKTSEASSLAKAMHKLQLAYFYCFKRRYGYVGRFWQGRFYSTLIENEAYLLTVGLYVESNPVKAGLVSNPEDYQWSSHNIYAYGHQDKLIDLDPCYLSLSNKAVERQQEYRNIMRAYLKMENKQL